MIRTSLLFGFILEPTLTNDQATSSKNVFTERFTDLGKLNFLIVV